MGANATQVLFWVAGSRLFESILPSDVTFSSPVPFAVPSEAPFGKRMTIPMPPWDGLLGLVGGLEGKIAELPNLGVQPAT